MKIDINTVNSFRKTIYAHYRTHSRVLPWRKTRNPYHILVSEVMLQQTQVERVIKKYHKFIKTFPNFKTLAHTPLRRILNTWQGLGYNRRARALKYIAEKVQKEFNGTLPSSLDTLKKFPGIGHHTASAILAFAFEKPAVFIETNIRAVFIHFFFSKKRNIHDKEIMLLVKKTLDTKNPAKWYWALMDYGAMLKSTGTNPNRRSLHYRKQSAFKGSNRELRGKVLKVLIKKPRTNIHTLAKKLDTSLTKIKRVLTQLKKDGLLPLRHPCLLRRSSFGYEGRAPKLRNGFAFRGVGEK